MVMMKDGSEVDDVRLGRLEGFDEQCPLRASPERSKHEAA